MKKLTINNTEFILEDKQSRHIHPEVTNRVYAVHYNVGKLPEHKEELWAEKGYSVINKVAYAMSQENGLNYKTQFHKSLWFVLFNQPSTLILYTGRLDDIQLGVIKFCITHGITVGLEDLTSNIKRVIPPVCNLFRVELFQTLKIDNLKASDLQTDSTERYYKNRNILLEARNQYMAPIWEAVNNTLEDIIQFYQLYDLEVKMEKAVKADRYKTQSILNEANMQISFFVYNEFNPPTFEVKSRLDDPAVQDMIIKELIVWAPAFEINLKLFESETDTMTYMSRSEMKVSKWSRRDTVSDMQYLKKVYKTKRKLQKDQLNLIISAYLQIKFYREHVDEFLSDNYYICECGRPVSKKVSHCPYCDTLNKEFVTIIQLDDNRVKQLEAMTPEERERFIRKYNCAFDLKAKIMYVFFSELEDEQSYEAIEDYTEI